MRNHIEVKERKHNRPLIGVFFVSFFDLNCVPSAECSLVFQFFFLFAKQHKNITISFRMCGSYTVPFVQYL